MRTAVWMRRLMRMRTERRGGEMTEEQFDQVYELQQRIWSAVHDLVDKMTEGLPEEVDEEVRMRLTETFRFWRRN